VISMVTGSLSRVLSAPQLMVTRQTFKKKWNCQIRCNHFLSPEVDNPYSVTFLTRHLYLSDLWLGVVPKADAKKMCSIEIELRAQNMIRF